MVNMFVSAKCARALLGEEVFILADIDDAAFVLSGYDSGRITMHQALRSSVSYQRASVRAGLRTPVTLVGRWTGRARVSVVTNTLIPRCVATTTHRTRVSEMRPPESRVNRDPLIARPVIPEISNLQRRDL